ncbi:MAG: hypothetical protein OEM60_00795, partial [Gammaproteobacteria bacterium]|nr:hypothetical protein [Gammaproteobacteria bacterium]
AVLMPGRYAKNEISGGFLRSIDTYAYRMPIAAPLGIEEQDNVDAAESDDSAAITEAAVQLSAGSESRQD